MANNIFREKSIERVSSPEQLNDYIRVTSPGIWLTLGAVILLLIGFIVWGAVGKIETKVECVVLSVQGLQDLVPQAQEAGMDEIAFCFVKEGDIERVSLDDSVRIDNKEYPIEDIAEEPIAVDKNTFNEYTMHTFDLMEGEWVYPIKLGASFPNGTYKAEIITDSISPIMFLFN